MCIIIVGKNIPIETLRNAWRRNPHGGGFMFWNDNETKIFKGFMSFRQFWNAYKPHRNRRCVIHFRVATSGLIDAAMTHPFAFNGIAFCHNGVLFDYEIGKNKSDTYYFGKKFISQNSIETVIEKMTEYTKFGNRFAVLHNGKIYLIGEFVKLNGIYFSNLSFCNGG